MVVERVDYLTSVWPIRECDVSVGISSQCFSIPSYLESHKAVFVSVLPSLGELIIFDLLIFDVDGVSKAAFLFDAPFVTRGCGVAGTKPSIL